MNEGVQRVVLFGTESTGKTVLAQRLAEHFNEPWSAEYVREYWDAHGAKIGPGDLDAIARGQLANEEAAAARARQVVFCDTDLLTCTLWDDILFPGECPPWARDEAERRAGEAALYLLCDTDVPYVEDPQRCFPTVDGREQARRVWQQALVTRGLPVVKIRGPWAEREQSAIAAVTLLLAR